MWKPGCVILPGARRRFLKVGASVFSLVPRSLGVDVTQYPLNEEEKLVSFQSVCCLMLWLVLYLFLIVDKNI